MREILEKYASAVNRRLDELMDEYTEKNAGDQLICAEAMRYSLRGGGKRIRPVLVMEFARLGGGDESMALDAACALEMIHTFSLIHDDLPCMDDDDMRRGQPSCHKKYGEAVALLAGDALENYAFEVIARDDRLSAEQRIRLVRILSEAVGVTGMIGGQIIDIRNTGEVYDGEKLLKMYSMKTGALLRCACEMGCVCAGREDLIPAARKYAADVGLAFQIVDDILDITADEKVLGKPVHSDKEQNKATYPAVFGMDNAKKKAAELTASAVLGAKMLGSTFLEQLTEHLLDRKY
ncbi:MAG: polyprenyl synthetase family protein [Huintestinicola sp.]